MEYYTVPVGSGTVKIRAHANDKCLRHIDSSYVFAEPNWEYGARLDGFPLIIATVMCGQEKPQHLMILAHTQNTSVISDIIDALREKGARIADIVMCIQFAEESLESLFIDCACQAGLRYVWSMNTWTPNRFKYTNRRFLVVKRVALTRH
jgi:hypothetical protein